MSVEHGGFVAEDGAGGVFSAGVGGEEKAGILADDFVAGDAEQSQGVAIAGDAGSFFEDEQRAAGSFEDGICEEFSVLGGLLGGLMSPFEFAARSFEFLDHFRRADDGVRLGSDQPAGLQGGSGLDCGGRSGDILQIGQQVVRESIAKFREGGVDAGQHRDRIAFASPRFPSAFVGGRARCRFSGVGSSSHRSVSSLCVSSGIPERIRIRSSFRQQNRHPRRAGWS